MPDITDYYWAVCVYQLKHWFTSAEPPLWVDIKLDITPFQDLFLLLLSDTWKPCDSKALTMPMQASLLSCGHLTTNKSSSKTPTYVSFPLQIFEARIPLLSVKTLFNYGIQEANALYISNSYSLDGLIKKYHILAPHRFTCIRRLYFIAKYPQPIPSMPPLIWDFYTHPMHNKRDVPPL